MAPNLKATLQLLEANKGVVLVALVIIGFYIMDSQGVKYIASLEEEKIALKFCLLQK